MWGISSRLIIVLSILPLMIALCNGCLSTTLNTQMDEDFESIITVNDQFERIEKLTAFAQESPLHEKYLYDQLQARIKQSLFALEQRASLVQALSQAGSESSGAAILGTVRDDPSVAVKYAAGRALYSAKSSVSPKQFPVKKYIDLFSPWAGIYMPAIVRNEAVKGIAELYGREELDFFARMLNDKDFWVHNSARQAIEKYGKPEDLQLILAYVAERRGDMFSECGQLCWMLRTVTGEKPPFTDNEIEDELKWWVSRLKDTVSENSSQTGAGQQ